MPDAKSESQAFSDERAGGAADIRNPEGGARADTTNDDDSFEHLADLYYIDRATNGHTDAQAVAAVLDARGFNRNPQYDAIKAFCLAEYNDRVGKPVVSSAAPNTAVHTATPAVTLTGLGFDGATGVTFGGVAATSVVVVSDTEITCVAPALAGAGTYDIVVTTPQGSTTAGNGRWTAT